MGRTGQKQTMKKSLLKASLICLGVTLLCGLSSFMVPERVKLQQSCQTVTVSNDTIITSEGEESECIQKIVVEIDRSGCKCSLTISYGEPGAWILCLTNDCTRRVHAICEYQIYGKDGVHDKKTNTKEVTIGGNMRSVRIDSGSLDKSVCEVIDLQVCFADPESPNNQNH